MWMWLLGGYAVFFLMIVAAAAGVALFVRDSERGERAYRVLKLLLSAGTGLGVVTGAAVRLLEAGLW